jgi:hypothetical protein
MTSSHDIIVHELTARLSSHRIFLLESDKLRSWRTPLDIVVLPNDFSDYFLEYQLYEGSGRPWGRRRFFRYVTYLSGKIYDILEPDGRFILLMHSYCPNGSSQTYHVQFKSEEERKSFLLFSHIFKTDGKYNNEATKEGADVHLPDLCCYLSRFALSEPHLKHLLDHRDPDELCIDEIDDLPHLDLRLPQGYTGSPEKHCKGILQPYFETVQLERKSLKHYHKHWEGRLEIDQDLPEYLLLFVGKPRQPAVNLASLEEELKASGLMGCSLSLVAEYRNTFRYVLDVLKILDQIRHHEFPKLPELERTRLRSLFEWERSRSRVFNTILALLDQISELEEVHECLNPDQVESETTPILENIAKMSLYGFTPDQLREILLIVVGHTTMSRIVFGKLPSKTLASITDKAQRGNYQEIVDLLRVCRLMSMAEMAASFGDAFKGEHGKELFLLYMNAIRVATDSDMDWEKLQDLQISSLGGIQNKAVREMMKFFNLFEFLDNWQEFEQKGPCQKEVLCNYESQNLKQLEEALELTRIVAQFKHQFLYDHPFAPFYFFRRFLDTEFHGIVRLFHKLGVRAGFILLWITVNVAEKHIINFNPILAKIPQDHYESRISKIKEILLRIPIEKLRSQFLEEIKKTLEHGRPAFIFDSSIRLMNNRETRAVDVSFVDLKENLKQIESLITHFQVSKLQDISLRDFQEVERLFSELESFHHYLKGKGARRLDEHEAGFSHSLGLSPYTEIQRIENKLKSIFLTQVLMPQEIYDILSVLATHCPEILRFILPEFHALGNLVEIWPTRQKQSLGAYAMRCLQKFQALIMKDREAFQDQSTFYQLAKQEFGPLAEEGMGVSHTQMEILENLVNRIQQNALLHQTLTLALLFQDVGKIEKYTKRIPESCVYCTHAERGAVILEQSNLLEKYQLKPQVRQWIISLIRYHGLIGHIIQGEDPIACLEYLIKERDDQLLDAFVLHSILAAAAVQEGLMTSDLLDMFLDFRGIALQVIKSKSSWQGWLEEHLREKEQAVLDDFDSIPQTFHLCSPKERRFCVSAQKDPDEVALWRGRQIAAFERLLRLMGIMWVDYQDLQMYLLSMPVSFIHHKKGLKSVGLTSFEKQLETAAKLFHSVSSLESVRCHYLLHCLDTLGGAFRVYDFYPIARYIEVEECLKLLLISFRAFHHYFGKEMKGGLISFRRLSQNIEQKHEAFQNELRNLPCSHNCLDEKEFPSFLQAINSLTFQVNSHELAISLDFKDPVPLDHMIQSLQSLWTHDELTQCYQNLMDELRQLPYETEDYQKELTKVFRAQWKKVNEDILKTFQESSNQLTDFYALQRIEGEIQAVRSKVDFSEEQQLLLEELFEHHRARIRSHYLDGIYCTINDCSSKETLLSYWNKIKYELLSFRSYVGKEYESLIAEFIDQRLTEMDK